MTILIILTCLITIGTCVWIVRNDKRKLIKKPIIESNMDEIVFKFLALSAGEAMKEKKEDPKKKYHYNSEDIVQVPENKSGAGGYAPRKHFDKEGYDTTDWAILQFPTIKSKKLARKKKRK